MYNLDLGKADEPEIKLPTSIQSQKKKGNSRKTSTSSSLTTQKPLTLWITTNWKILKEVGITDHLTCVLRNVYAGQEATVRTRHNGSVPNWVPKEYIKAIYCHPTDLMSVQSTSYKMPGWMKHKLESRLQQEISITSDMQMNHP